jgi:hypothetical protein
MGEDILVLANTDSDDHDIDEHHGATDMWIANFSEAPLAHEAPTVNEIRVFPNPAGHRIYVDGNHAWQNIAIRDMTGHRVIQRSSVSTSGMDVSALPAGLYVIDAIDVNGVKYVGRMVIQ